MVTAAKTVSQVLTHMAISFAIAYGITGSAILGGLALVVEPVINVMLLPLHERVWEAVRHKAVANRARYLAIAAEKVSQAGMHMGLAFAVMYWATGSMALGGAAALLEPVCNVVLMPIHDRAWDNFRAKHTAARVTA